MPLDEFSLIRQFFSGLSGDDVALGVGDDCALLELKPGELLAVTTDTLVTGVHFPDNAPPEQLGQRCLRVNLSDLAAVGAEPRWFQLALTLPSADKAWLSAFSAGLKQVAQAFGCSLVGGDTTRGPLAITITAMGTVPLAQALMRKGARAGDKIYVTGSLGDARAALATLQAGATPLGADSRYLLSRFWQPQPRIAEGIRLRGLATAAIDISDGLLADLGHICQASGVGAELRVDQLPLSPQLLAYAGEETAREWALTGGDDYELCFTAPGESLPKDLGVTCVGCILPGNTVHCLDASGNEISIKRGGYVHF